MRWLVICHDNPFVYTRWRALADFSPLGDFEGLNGKQYSHYSSTSLLQYHSIGALQNL